MFEDKQPQKKRKLPIIIEDDDSSPPPPKKQKTEEDMPDSVLRIVNFQKFKERMAKRAAEQAKSSEKNAM